MLLLVLILLVKGNSLNNLPTVLRNLANWPCYRLKTTLDLPQIEPRPPIAPKLYKTLYAYFDRTLVSGGGRKRRRQNDEIEEARPLPQRHTQTKEQTLGFRTNRTPKKGLRYGNSKIDERLPKWVGPAIRLICKEMDTPKAIPHVYVGVESVWLLPCPTTNRTEKAMEGKLPALVAVIWSFVAERLREKRIKAAEETEQLRAVFKLMKGLRENEEVVKRVGDSDESWESWESLTAAHYKAWVAEVNDFWLDMDWFNNISVGSGVNRKADDDEEDSIVQEELSSEEVLRLRKREIANNPGLGRMVDLRFEISDEKTYEYEQWKQAMLTRITELASREGVDKMDTGLD